MAAILRRNPRPAAKPRHPDERAAVARWMEESPVAQMSATREKAATHAAQVAGFKVNDVVTLRDGRRRYVVAVVEPNYGGEQTYYLTALSGGEAGSAPSGVREAEMRRAKDQTLKWEGVGGHKLRQRYVGAAGQLGGGTPETRMAASQAAAATVKAAGLVAVDPGVTLARRLRLIVRGRVTVSQPKRGQATAWVTIPIKLSPYSQRALEPFSKRLWEVYERIVQAGMTVSNIEAGHGRIIVVENDDSRYGMPAEKVWEEFAKAAHMSGEKANPARRVPGKRAKAARRNPAKPNRHLALLSIESRVGPEALRLASAELRAAGESVSAEDLLRALKAARAFQNPVTGEWTVPGAQPPTWGYDDLQDAIMDRTGLRGPALHRAWLAVKGHLRLRWAAGNRTRPLDAVVVRWVRESQKANPAKQGVAKIRQKRKNPVLLLKLPGYPRGPISRTTALRLLKEAHEAFDAYAFAVMDQRRMLSTPGHAADPENYSPAQMEGAQLINEAATAMEAYKARVKEAYRLGKRP